MEDLAKGSRDARSIDNSNHTLLAMAGCRAIVPNRIGVVHGNGEGVLEETLFSNMMGYHREIISRLTLGFT